MNPLKWIAGLWQWLYCWITFQPHFIVGGKDDPYLLRWFVLPRNPLFNVYLHKFCRDDDDRALHDHPWWSASLVLRNGYLEQTEEGTRFFAPGSLIFRNATDRHRIIVSEAKGSAWTLFVTGPKVRVWGFHCPKGFVPWYEFVDQSEHGNVGRGCD